MCFALGAGVLEQTVHLVHLIPVRAGEAEADALQLSKPYLLHQDNNLPSI